MFQSSLFPLHNIILVFWSCYVVSLVLNFHRHSLQTIFSCFLFVLWQVVNPFTKYPFKVWYIYLLLHIHILCFQKDFGPHNSWCSEGSIQITHNNQKLILCSYFHFSCFFPIVISASVFELEEWCSSLISPTYALTISPVAMSLEEFIPPNHPKSQIYSILIRTGLVISTLLVGLSVPFFGKYIFTFLFLSATFGLEKNEYQFFGIFAFPTQVLWCHWLDHC